MLLCTGCDTHDPKQHLKNFYIKELEKGKANVAASIAEAETAELNIAYETTPKLITKDLYVPFKMVGHDGDKSYTGYNFEHNGIKYIGLFLENESMNAAAVVDYSQFFVQDTLFVGGRTWVALTTAPNINENE